MTSAHTHAVPSSTISASARWATSHASLVLTGLVISVVTRHALPLALGGSLGLAALVWLHRHQLRAAGGFGPANWVTTSRVMLAVCLCAAQRIGGPGCAWLALAVLALDCVDGWLARRTGCASAFGARFDMESDAFFVASASFAVFVLGRLGEWILIAGALRYAYVLTLALLCHDAAEAPRTLLGRSVFAIIGLSFPMSLWPVPRVYAPYAVCALVLLAASFARSLAWSLSPAHRRSAQGTRARHALGSSGSEK